MGWVKGFFNPIHYIWVEKNTQSNPIHHRVQPNPRGLDWTFKITTYLLIKPKHSIKLTQTIWLVHQTKTNKSKFISYNYVGISYKKKE